ncbi:MAG: diacylglycerol kinase [Hydrogenophilales bacterium 16-64-46]|nr:MAG: diacylglycerol kinase [Hydrogenophilales bacterium 12-64-13]OYZ05119.1 MAG: diacylglycerol kinase [Hydrogenophilales bacterium 16-64-46]OZA37937.1 MAG: diacylglycerol kinase [Hydrogenophilales bacterium 17-64-34]HQT00533.1 dihydrofolate reductase [Thiobacillus sp.]
MGQNRPRLNVIAALAKNRVIGIENRLPWRLPEDLAHFKALTLGHPVLMGRKTFESLGRPLPGRTNIVITRNPDYRPEGVTPAASIPAALAACEGHDEVFFIGGAELYAQAIPLADRLYLTEVDIEAQGDAWFPEFDRMAFVEIARQSHLGDKADRLHFDFVTYARREAVAERAAVNPDLRARNV